MKLASLRVSDLALGSGWGPTTGPRAATGGAGNTVTGGMPGVVGGGCNHTSTGGTAAPTPPTALPPLPRVGPNCAPGRFQAEQRRLASTPNLPVLNPRRVGARKWRRCMDVNLILHLRGWNPHLKTARVFVSSRTI